LLFTSLRCKEQKKSVQSHTRTEIQICLSDYKYTKYFFIKMAIKAGNKWKVFMLINDNNVAFWCIQGPAILTDWFTSALSAHTMP